MALNKRDSTPVSGSSSSGLNKANSDPSGGKKSALEKSKGFAKKQSSVKASNQGNGSGNGSGNPYVKNPSPNNCGCLLSIFKKSGSNKFKGKTTASGCLLPILGIFLALLLVLFLVLFFGGLLPGCNPSGGTPAGGSGPAQQPPAVTPVSVPVTHSGLEVYYLDVGQGDATLALCDGMSLLIDSGKAEDYGYVSACLHKLGVDKLDYLVMAVPDDDHTGCMASVIEEFTPETYLCLSASDNNAAVSAAVRKLSINKVIPVCGTTFNLGSALCEMIGPAEDSSASASLALRLTYGSNSFLFLGDSGTEAAQAILDYAADRRMNLNADVLKLPCHGRDGATSDAFLQVVQPAYSVISVGSNGLPTDGTVKQLTPYQSVILRTDADGSVLVRSDGSTITYVVHYFE